MGQNDDGSQIEQTIRPPMGTIADYGHQRMLRIPHSVDQDIVANLTCLLTGRGIVAPYNSTQTRSATPWSWKLLFATIDKMINDLFV